MEVSNDATKEKKARATEKATQLEAELEASRKLLKERKEQDPVWVQKGLWGSIYVLLQRASNTPEGTVTSAGLVQCIAQYGTPQDHTAAFTTVFIAVDEELGPRLFLKTLFQNWSYWPDKREEWGCTAPGGALTFKG